MMSLIQVSSLVFFNIQFRNQGKVKGTADFVIELDSLPKKELILPSNKSSSYVVVNAFLSEFTFLFRIGFCKCHQRMTRPKGWKRLEILLIIISAKLVIEERGARLREFFLENGAR